MRKNIYIEITKKHLISAHYALKPSKNLLKMCKKNYPTDIMQLLSKKYEKTLIMTKKHIICKVPTTYLTPGTWQELKTEQKICY